jgi:hypothetical protein
VRRTPRRLSRLLIIVALASCVPAAPALASHNQVTMFEADAQLRVDPDGTMAVLKGLGVGTVRVSVQWNSVTLGALTATDAPAGFHPADPRAGQYDWRTLDRIVEAARADGITVDLSLTGGAPLWAIGADPPPGARRPNWKPAADQYGAFVMAVATRYSGRFRVAPGAAPLPRVSTWEIWNEPNFGPDLAPQAVDGSRLPVAAHRYRQLVDQGWAALVHTGHGHDRVILGNLDARGLSAPASKRNPDGWPGIFGATKPLTFLRELYCVDHHLRPLRGAAAREQGCPTTSAGTRGFRRAHPALFAAAGVGDHPYPLTQPPVRTTGHDPNQADFSQLPNLVRLLDQLERAYHSRHRFALYNNEFGYITNPPNHSQRFPSPATAAAWINWAEYLSWRDPRIHSFDQYLLHDPNPVFAPEYGGFASGLVFYGGATKPAYDAFRLPVFLPSATVKHGHRLLVWGDARPAHAYGNAHVAIQFQAHRRGRFTTVANVTVHNPQGYFETAIRVPSSGAVRLAWAYPGGATVYSRTAPLTVR